MEEMQKGQDGLVVERGTSEAKMTARTESSRRSVWWVPASFK